MQNNRSGYASVGFFFNSGKKISQIPIETKQGIFEKEAYFVPIPAVPGNSQNASKGRDS